MPTDLNEIYQKARELPDADKLALVDSLLAQFDRPNPEVDRVWAEESCRRRQACHTGRLQARDYEQVVDSFPRT